MKSIRILAAAAVIAVLSVFGGAQVPPAWQDHANVAISSVVPTQVHGRSLTRRWASYQTIAVGVRIGASSTTLSSVRGFYIAPNDTFIDSFSVFTSTVWALSIGTNTASTVIFTERQ